MLVRFLSFAASVIGTRRYRPILLSLTAVILSTASIAAVASVLDDQPHQEASASQQLDTKADQQTTSGLDGLDKQTPRDEGSADAVAPQTQPPATTTDNTKPPATTGNQTTPAPELLLSTASVTLSASNQAALVQVNTSDKSTATWSVASDNLDSSVVTNLESTSGSTITLRLKLEKDATPGTYQLTVNAKDAARSLDLSKKITVIVAD